MIIDEKLKDECRRKLQVINFLGNIFSFGSSKNSKIEQDDKESKIQGK